MSEEKRLTAANVHFEWQLRVRFGECDPQGIVFNPNYLVYVDVALTEWWRELSKSISSEIQKSVDTVVASANLDFLTPAKDDDVLAILLGIETAGSSSLVTSFTIRGPEKTHVTGRTRHVFVDPDSLRPVQIPQSIKEAIELMAGNATTSHGMHQ